MSDRIPIQTEFELLRPYLTGTPRQFLVYSGDTYCVRAHPDDLPRRNPALNPCDGCPYLANGCEIAGEFPVEAAHRSKDGVVSGMEPHVRRGIGMEERPFLVLLFKPGHSHATLPTELWDNPHADKAMDERNLHYLLTDLKRATFFTFKGQLRYYGTRGEFAGSPYAAYLDVFDEWDGKSHHPVSMDKSAIEPRVCTIVTDEPEWRRVFEGSPKVISREIELAAEPEKDPSYLLRANGSVFCFLDGELDKADFAEQCGKCPLANLCRTVVDHVKNVSGDWHAINAEGFFGAAFAETSDPYVRKEYRNKSKIGGLASIYGGSKFTLSRSLNMTEDEAEGALIRFFSKLGVARKYMDGIKSALKTHGTVRTRFGRRRDMRRWSHSQAMMPLTRKRRRTQEEIAALTASRKAASGPVDEYVDEVVTETVEGPDGAAVERPVMVPDRKKRFKDMGYAERTGLNYPIQGTAAELMKMAMIAIDKLIQSRGWNPLVGMTIPQRIRVGNRAYEQVTFALLSTVHDELLYLIREGQIDTVIPLAYTAMQLGDVMKALRTGFALELDVEYDRHRAWTAGTSVPTAKIYLLNRLMASPTGPRANALVVKIEDTHDVFYAEVSKACEHVVNEGENCHLIVENKGRFLYPPGNPRFDREFLNRLQRSTGVLGRWVAVSEAS